jgi:hypothetical protein
VYVIEAYREHGSEALSWALWRLFEKAHRSFYFTPSIRLWLKYPKSREDNPDAEHSRWSMVEAKSSSGVDDAEINQLAMVAERIMPDVFLLESMDAESYVAPCYGTLKSGPPLNATLETLHFSDVAIMTGEVAAGSFGKPRRQNAPGPSRWRVRGSDSAEWRYQSEADATPYLYLCPEQLECLASPELCPLK